LAGAPLLTSTAWAQQNEPYYGHHMWYGGWHTWFFGPLMMLVFIAVIVVVVVLIVRWLGGPAHGPAPHHRAGDAALDILRERYARGEIDKAEFEEKRASLKR
jgi:putative membrane protein